MFSGSLTDRPPAIVSASVTVQLTLPNILAAGVKLMRPVKSIAGAISNKVVVAALQLTVKPSGSDSPGPEVMLLAQAALYAPESSATVMVAGPAVKEGASFTAANHGSHTRSVGAALY
jgi:hypothetical protein